MIDIVQEASKVRQTQQWAGCAEEEHNKLKRMVRTSGVYRSGILLAIHLDVNGG